MTAALAVIIDVLFVSNKHLAASRSVVSGLKGSKLCLPLMGLTSNAGTLLQLPDTHEEWRPQGQGPGDPTVPGSLGESKGPGKCWRKYLASWGPQDCRPGRVPNRVVGDLLGISDRRSLGIT